MTNEIKEILDDLDFCKNIKRGKILLNSNECDIFLDYINNLEYEKDNYKFRIYKAIDYIEKNTTKEYEVPLIDSFSISYQKLIDILNGEDEND